MYNPDGATANIRQSTTPLRIDLNRDWELFQQPESRAFYELWEATRPRLALDLHHMGQSPIVEGTNELNTFQIGARSIDPSRMTALQWLTNRQMAMISTAAVSRLGPGNVARYPLIDITNAVISRMLLAAQGRMAATRASRARARSSTRSARSGRRATACSSSCSCDRRWPCSRRQPTGASTRIPAPAGRTSPSVTASPAAADRAEHDCG
jgi:hypothetical protein